MDPPKEEKNDEKQKKEEKTERYRTMMVGEAPGEDLGYDPSTIPTEPIEPEKDD